MAGNFLKNCADASRRATFRSIFLASRGDIEEKLRPLVEGVEDFIPKPFFIKDLVGRDKKSCGPSASGKIAEEGRAAGVIEGRLEELGIADLMQSLEMGQKSCRLTVRRGAETCEMYFSAGQCKHARRGDIEGEEAVYPVVQWTEGEFEIDFTGTSDQTTITHGPPQGC